jgi:hypothetical protein
MTVAEREPPRRSVLSAQTLIAVVLISSACGLSGRRMAWKPGTRCSDARHRDVHITDTWVHMSLAQMNTLVWRCG